MSKEKKIFYFSAPLIILSILAAFFIDIKIVLIILFSLLLLIAYTIYKEKIGQELLIAFLFAIAVTSYYNYEYTTANILIGKINLFPLVAWTFGLVILREIYERIKEGRLPSILLIYISGLLILEHIGYYLFNIRLNSNFPSLLGLGIMHAPVGMKLFYLFAGPVYILITDYLEVK